MQHCTVCGSEVPGEARFCGKCGHVLSSIGTIEQEPTRTLDETSSTSNRDESSAKNELAQDDLTAIDTQQLTPHESNGHKPIEDSSTPGATVEPAVSENTQDSEAPEEASAHIDQLPEEASKVQSEEMLPVVPTKVLNADPVSPIVSPTTVQAAAPKAIRGSAKRWFIIALVILLIVGGSAAALVFLLHLPVPGNGGTPAAVTSPTSSTNVTAVNTVCPAGSTSCTTTTPTTTGPTPTVSGTASTSTVNMTFSGAVTGGMTVTNVARCGPPSSGSEYDIYVSGTVGNTPYTFVSRITSYTGPATYNTGHIFVVFSQQPLSPSTVWGNSGNLPARATINSDTKSGTMEIDLSGAVNTVHVSGSWNCA
jgi:hypothetical protein